MNTLIKKTLQVRVVAMRTPATPAHLFTKTLDTIAGSIAGKAPDNARGLQVIKLNTR